MSAFNSFLTRSRSAKKSVTLFITAGVVAALASALALGPALTTGSASAAPPTLNFNHNKRPVPNYDVNLSQFARRLPSTMQLQALGALGTRLGDGRITARWDKGTGSVDTIYDFASASSPLAPEAAARAFLESNAALFGINDMNTLRLKRNVAALAGNLLYFEQIYNGLSVASSGIGVVMDGERRVKMVSGPYQANLSLNTTPGLDAAAAVMAAQSDLERYRRPWAAGVAQVLNPALDLLASQLGVLASPHPELNVYPTANGARLAYTFLLFSRNPFGMFKYQVDALSGQILSRNDQVRYLQQQLPLTADVYPNYPAITQELKDQGIISVDQNGVPLGQLRIGLRNFDQSNVVTGVNGTLTGLHAHIENALAAKVPFAQAARGTWHFSSNNAAGLEGRTNEREHYGPNAEPAEHQDEISQFFYINSLLEYIDYLHRAGDAAHNRGFGEGDFPDTYPNQSNPLIGNVHIPNVLNPPQVGDPAFVEKLLGLDNAFSLPASQTIAGQEIVVNPTSYGHGYLLNDLAIDFAVPYHEGMHSISTPIAGLEGVPEGDALNEGQADLWAYSAAENPALGNYVINGFKLRELTRAAGSDPDLRQYLRHADSGLSYSQLGTSGAADFEEHRDGEIYAATMWDIRQLMLMYETGGSYKRPDLVTGAPSVSIQLGKENWERIFLGTIYVLGTLNPDTFVRSRDAMIIADAMLYPSDSSDPDSPGFHRSVIEQVYAAREMGINAEAPVGGRQAISTQVSNFTASQGRPSVPTGVSVALVSPGAARVSWQAVGGAFAYEILKREIGRENKRVNQPVFGHQYIDGDGTTDGYLHVAYLKADQTSYLDNGFIQGAFVPRGLKNPVSAEYVIRALGVNSNRQIGVSDNSAAASVATAAVNVTSTTQRAISNISFADGKTVFDQTIKNTGSGQFDGTAYTPVEFRIVSISNPSVTVTNSDNCGNGQPGNPASFYYREKLLSGQTSAPRRLAFNNPNSQLFTFDAVIMARVQADPAAATRYEPEPPTNFACFETRTFSATHTGIVPASDIALQLIPGVTFVDVPFTSQEGAYGVVGQMTSSLGLDMDLELLDAAGRVLSSSAGGDANELVASPIEPFRNYVFRVSGWAGVAQDFTIESTQHMVVHVTSTAGTPGGGAGGGVTPPAGGSLLNLVRFTVNPLTRTVTMQLLK
jgi:fungalysin metallopeptidase (M36)